MIVCWDVLLCTSLSFGGVAILLRSCGGVFCYSCSDHFVPVQSQLLNTPVRVCDGCFDKMDGHLSQSQEEGLADGLK